MRRGETMSNKKRGLGKGLSALIGDKPIVDTMLNEDKSNKGERVINLPLDVIVTKEDQPRKNFDKASLKDLSQSIKDYGVIQPILVRKFEDGYEIVAGERRFRASKLIDLKEIPAIIIDVDHEDSAKLALIENIQRENLNPIEEAMAYKQLMEDYNLKQVELANSLGKSRSYITNTMRLLNLDDKIVEYIYNGKLTPGHGKVLLGIQDKAEQLRLAEEIIDFNLNIRETEEEVKKVKTPKKAKKPARKREPYIVQLEDDLMQALGTKVNLIIGEKKGKIEIEYYGDEDLERLFDILVN